MGWKTTNYRKLTPTESKTVVAFLDERKDIYAKIRKKLNWNSTTSSNKLHGKTGLCREEALEIYAIIGEEVASVKFLHDKYVPLRSKSNIDEESEDARLQSLVYQLCDLLDDGTFESGVMKRVWNLDFYSLVHSLKTQITLKPFKTKSALLYDLCELVEKYHK